MTNTNIDMLKKLHDIGLLDDKAFIDGIKRATGGSITTKPLRDVPFTTGTPFNETPFTSAKPLGTIIGLPSITSTTTPCKYVSTGSPLTATFTPEQSDVEVVPYTENRSHLPQHAQDVLAWIDEAWDKTFREYNDTKKDWERYTYTDDDGVERAGWIHKPSRKMETDVKDMMEMFNLEFDSGNQP